MTTPRVTVPEAIEALKHCVENEKTHWSLTESCDPCVDAPVKYLRAAVEALSAAPAPEGGAIVRWRGENIPYTCPYPSIGVRGSPYGYNIDPGVGSGMDRLQRNWPDRAQVRDMRDRDGEITPLFPSYALATREEAPAEAGGRSFRDVFLSWHEETGTVERAGYGAAPIGQFQARWPDLHKRLWDAGMKSQRDLRDEWVRVAKECDQPPEALRAQPQAREDAQPVADEVLPVAWVIRTKDGHIRMWTMSEKRARAAAALWGMEARQEGLSPQAHPAPDALRADVDRLTAAFDGAVSLSWRRLSLARDLGSALTWALAEIDGETKYEDDGQRENCRDKADQALAALQAEVTK